jgi:hypothetical protein
MGRVSLGTEGVVGSGCAGAWGGFEPIFVGEEPVDLLEFVERDGRVGVRYPALDIIGWRDEKEFVRQLD